MRPFIEKDFWVYIVASKPRGVLYTGMTSDLVGRTEKHRERLIDGFAKKYWAWQAGLVRAARRTRSCHAAREVNQAVVP